MSQKMALFVSAALAVFVVIVAGALAMRLGGTPPAATQAGEPAPAAQVESEAVASSNTMDGLLQRLQAQNAALLQREHTYQQRLQEANRLLQQLVPAAPTGSDGTSVQWQEANRTMNASRAWSVRVKEDKRKRQDDKGARDHREEEEDDD